MRTLLNLGGTAVIIWTVLVAAPPRGVAQQPAAPKRVLVLQWGEREFRANEMFADRFQAALRSAAPEGIDYYSEQLETTRFPGESQSLLLRDYLRQKYAGRKVDVIVTRASPALEFLLKNRTGLFPDVPIVFVTERPVAAHVTSGSDVTGIVYLNNYVSTIDLALKLHPQTEQLFIISGTLTGDKAFESIARKALQRYENSIGISYLTDLAPEDLIARMKSMPKRSVILYVWQQARNRQGKVVETQEILRLIAGEAQVPIYGMSFVNVGLGIIGGYVWTMEGNAAKLAEIALRVANGEPARDIPIENAPETPMFDWHQLRRWGIREDRLPQGSVIRFREPTMWEQYKWRIAATLFVLGLQAILIVALLVERQRARRAQQKLREHEEHLEHVVEQRTAEVVEARDQALAANRSKSMFLANMSHELRTPLNAILGFSALVRENAALSDQDRKDLAVVGSSGEHLLGLIDDVLDMAKIETGGSVVEDAPFDLHSLVGDTVNMLREPARAKNLELLLDISSQAPRFIRSDAGKLRQVLTNLLGNAVKFTDEGSVVVRLDARQEDNSRNQVLILDVEDTGIGISQEEKARIFEPFVQAAGARNRKGTGLGLSISRHFVQLLGGTIQVESTPGRGSRFRVEVPAPRAEASEVRAETHSMEQVTGLEPGQPDYRILIVEDQRENWVLLQRLLQTAGFHARIAEDGRQAVETFRTWRPHFIWMDVRLPVMSGLDAAKRIREIESKREVKIVAVTASAFASQREQVLAAGFDDFLRKPYRPAEIFDCMARHLGVRYLRGTTQQSSKKDASWTLCPEHLAALPAGLRDELEGALVSLDSKWIAQVVSKVSKQNASLARVLERLTDQSSYSPILHALQSRTGREATGVLSNEAG